MDANVLIDVEDALPGLTTIARTEEATLLIGAVALGVTYLAVVAALGITEDDRLVWEALRGRRKLITS